MLQIAANPTGAREVPFQFAMCGGMREIRERGIQLAKKSSQAAQQLRGVRIYFGEDRSRNISEEPDEAFRSIGERRNRKGFAILGLANARQRKLRGSRGQMLQRLALHLDEGVVPRGVHYFQDEFAAIGRGEKKVVVVFAGKRPGGTIEAKNFAREPNSFRFGDRLGHTRFGNHALNLIRKG